MAEKKTSEPQNNLRFYEQLRDVPQHALKPIKGGRLAGMSDVNPVWRIKIMTETFGPCGIGWKYEITKQWQEQYGQEVKAYTNINLYIKIDDQWSDAIPGTGGATLVEVNSKGYAYVNDEGFKMSLTDAMSVCMRSLGVAADVYFSKDKEGLFDTKYAVQFDAQQYQQQRQQAEAPQPQVQQPVQASSQQVMAEIQATQSEQELMALWTKYPQWQNDKTFRDAWAAKRATFQKQ